jgi:hypothetical protein
MLVGVDQHQARSVDAEHRMGGVHDLTDRLLDVHLAEAQPAKLHQCLMDIMQRDAHRSSPNADQSAGQTSDSG